MAFEDLDKGAKIDLHIHLYERQVARIDAKCRELGCSRSMLIDKMVDMTLAEVSVPAKKGTTK